MFNTKLWITKVKSEAYVKSNNFKEKLGFVKASVLSIIIGLLVGALFIFINGENGFGFLWTALAKSLTVNINRTLVYFGVFILIGLGLALGFQLKIFNMGGSGQILSGLLITYVFYSIMPLDGDKKWVYNHNYSFLIFLTFIISGLLISTLCGVLKVFLNFHEVASSILLNWIFYYLLKWFISKKWGGVSSPLLNDKFATFGGGSPVAFCLIVAFLAIIITYIVYRFTTIGYKARMVSKSPSAAQYAGIKSKWCIVSVMAVQGALISLGGYFYYHLIQGSITLTRDIVPLIGFDGIPVALVAFNNILGIIPISFLWAILKEGSSVAITTPQYNSLQPETADLIFGIIIYFSTLYVLFIKFELIEKIKHMIYLKKDIVTKNKINELKVELQNEKKLLKEVNSSQELVTLKKEIVAANNSEQKNILISKYNELKSFLKNKHIKNIKNYKYKINELIKNGYKNYQEKSIKGLDIKYSELKISNSLKTVDKVIKEISFGEEKNKVLESKIKALIESLKEKNKDVNFENTEKEDLNNYLNILKEKFDNFINKLSKVNENDFNNEIDQFVNDLNNEFDMVSKKYISNQEDFKKYLNNLSKYSKNNNYNKASKCNAFISETNQENKLLKEKYINSKKQAKEYLKSITTQYKNEINGADENKKNELSKKYFDEIMGVAEKYGIL